MIGPTRQHKRRRVQVGAGYSNAMITSSIGAAKKAGSSRVGQMIIDDAIDFILTAYKNIKNRLFRQKKAPTTSRSYAGDYTHEGFNKNIANMSKGISNLEIERIFNGIDNADLNDNFLGVSFQQNK